jgi:hypothetical protein
MKTNQNRPTSKTAKITIMLIICMAILTISLLTIRAFAEVACYGYMNPDGDPLHSSSASTVICSADCTGSGYCFDYTYDPDGTIPKTCDSGNTETGTKCIHDTTDVTKSGKEGDPTCVLEPGSTTVCQLAGQCLNWRSITNTIIHVPQDYTDSYDCRPVGG